MFIITDLIKFTSSEKDQTQFKICLHTTLDCFLLHHISVGQPTTANLGTGGDTFYLNIYQFHLIYSQKFLLSKPTTFAPHKSKTR